MNYWMITDTSSNISVNFLEKYKNVFFKRKQNVQDLLKFLRVLTSVQRVVEGFSPLKTSPGVHPPPLLISYLSTVTGDQFSVVFYSIQQK